MKPEGRISLDDARRVCRDRQPLEISLLKLEHRQAGIDPLKQRVQVVANLFGAATMKHLVGNALEHGAPPITVAVATDGELVHVSVSDCGQGIGPQPLPRVFDRFYKADRARSAGGSGLGLAIARENARLHGGDITVASQVGAGTTFTLSLPFREVNA